MYSRSNVKGPKRPAGVDVMLHEPRHYMDVSGELHAPGNLTRGKKPKYLLYRKLSLLYSQSRHGRK